MSDNANHSHYMDLIMFRFGVYLYFLLSAGVCFASTVGNSHEFFHSIKLKKDQYITGEFSFSKPFIKAELIDENERLVRVLAKQQNTFKLYLLAQADQHFKVRVTSSNKNLATINLSEPISQPAVSDNETLLSPTMQSLITRLKSNNKVKVVDEFWQNVEKEGTPLIEYEQTDALVTFLWRGARHNVRLFGAPFGSHQDLEKIKGTDIWFKTYRLPTDSLISYQLAPDVPHVPNQPRASRIAIMATKQQDPLNPTTWQFEGTDNYATHSILTLKDTKHSPYLRDVSENFYSLTQHTIESIRLNNTRDIAIYKHKDAIPQSPTILFFDGKNYQSKLKVPNTLTNLVNDKKIPPVNAVFVSNVSRKTRGQELPPNPDFAWFMANELMPWLTKKGLSPSAQNTVLSGSSFGGLASMYVAMQYPNVFGNVLSQSGSFWWSPREGTKQQTEPQWLTRKIARDNYKKLSIYMNAGVFETGYFTIDILESNRHLRDVLNAKGYTVKYHEFSGGHDSYVWRNELADGLIYLLTNRKIINDEVK